VLALYRIQAFNALTHLIAQIAFSLLSQASLAWSFSPYRLALSIAAFRLTIFAILQSIFLACVSF